MPEQEAFAFGSPQVPAVPLTAVLRIYLAPETRESRAGRIKAGGNKKKSFTEGWVEFSDKRRAKRLDSTEDQLGVGRAEHSAERRDHAVRDQPRDGRERAAGDGVAHRIRRLSLDVELLVHHAAKQRRHEPARADGIDLQR